MSWWLEHLLCKHKGWSLDPGAHINANRAWWLTSDSSLVTEAWEAQGKIAMRPGTQVDGGA